jgi:hypothetical protein
MIHRRLGAGLAVLLWVSAASVPADEPAKGRNPSFQVPYRLTETKHILVRAKLNGKGPYNFVLDTGAPALFVGTGVAKKVGVAANNDGWGTFERMELEGGLVLDKIQGQVADPFQLEGMNQMGLAGAELHGVLGYNLLARYKIEIDFNRNKMVWTRLNGFEPEMPQRMGGKAPANLNAMGGLVKMVAALMGKKEAAELRLGGFLGVELVEKEGGLIVEQVIDQSPAAEAGLRKGDRLSKLQDQELKTMGDLEKLAGKLAVGDSVQITVIRDNQEKQLAAKLGKGF